MLTNGPTEANDYSDADFMDPTNVWAHRVKNEAVLVMAQVGEAPAQLQYRHCHRECRRQLLLQSRVRNEYTKPGMVQVMRVAMQLANSGSIPGPGEHGRNSEFIKRCVATLKALAPEEESDLKKLSAEEQSIIRHILGGDTSVPYDGCLNQECLDKETTWVVKNGALAGESFLPIRHCARCKLPKAWGRTVHSVRDVLRPLWTREAGKRSFSEHPLLSFGK